MRYHVIACDYDGTLATSGLVEAEVIASLQRVRESGRRLILVTGRELDQLLEIFSDAAIFDWVIAENGAVAYCPATREETLLADPPPRRFGATLRERGVEPLSEGRVIVATWQPHEVTALEVIRDLGLELQVVFNKGAVMVLPSGVNKATGLHFALSQLRLSPHNAVAIGDAENDHAFLNLCECAVAVANALPVTKEYADLVTGEDHGAGVIELAELLVKTDLQDIAGRLIRHEIMLGTREDGKEVRLQPYGVNVMIAGTSGGGKSTLATGLLERLAEKKYQYCIIDPEGDYSSLDDVVVLGDNRRPPSPDEVLDLLSEPEQNAVINLIGISIEHRPDFFMKLLPGIQQLRNETGRPHWILIDETHHLLPAARGLDAALPSAMQGLIIITVHPDHVDRAVLATVNTVLAIGETPQKTLQALAVTLQESAPACPEKQLNPGEAMLWLRHTNKPPFWLKSTPTRSERRRHTRKYMEGELAPEISFYFTGPDQKLHLRAQNLQVFLQLAEGVDDATWNYHLQRGDYSRWFREVLKDDELAQQIAQTDGMSARESREFVKDKIEARYTAAE